MSEANPPTKEALSKPHASYPIVARVMRELVLWWPKAVDADGSLAVVDLSQSDVWESRMAIDAENCGIAEKSFDWLKEEGLIELSDDGTARHATLTKKGLDFVHSVPAFHRYQQATSRTDREGLVPTLDKELSHLLGPGFLSWLQVRRSRE